MWGFVFFLLVISIRDQRENLISIKLIESSLSVMVGSKVGRYDQGFMTSPETTLNGRLRNLRSISSRKAERKAFKSDLLNNFRL